MDPLRASQLPRFDPNDPAVEADPLAVYATLREAGPLCRFVPNQWGVTRHAEVAALLRDPRLGSDIGSAYYREALGDGAAARFFENIAISKDAPRHPAVRSVLAKAFTPRLVRQLRGRVQSVVDDLLAPALEAGSFDAVDDLAYPLPIAVVCELIGIPAADRAAVRPKATELVRVLTTVVQAFTTALDAAERQRMNDIVGWLHDYVRALFDDRRHEQGDDLLGHIARAVDDGTATIEELVDNVVFLFYAGFETTASMIATGCAGLLRFPSEWERLQADPGLAPSAVTEFLRFEAPVQSATRAVLEPLEVAGRTIRPGRLLVLMLGCANHDERQFDDPGRLDIGRHPNPHLGFGGGAHHCVGSVLATLEGTVAFETIARRAAVVEAAGEPVRAGRGTFRCFTHIPVAVKAA